MSMPNIFSLKLEKEPTKKLKTGTRIKVGSGDDYKFDLIIRVHDLDDRTIYVLQSGNTVTSPKSNYSDEVESLGKEK